MYQTIQCPNLDSIINRQHFQHLKYCTKEYYELKHGQKRHIGEKINYTKTECIVQTGYWIMCTFHQLCMKCSVFCLSNWRNGIWNTSLVAILSVQIHILWPRTHTCNINFKILLKWYKKNIQTQTTQMLNVLKVATTASIVHNWHHMN
jgi:hypothetical protein